VGTGRDIDGLLVLSYSQNESSSIQQRKQTAERSSPWIKLALTGYATSWRKYEKLSRARQLPMSINTKMLNWVVGTRTSPAFAEGKVSEPFKSLG
jgi:hypothetical protein